MATQQVIDELKQLYKSKLLPVERTFMWEPAERACGAERALGARREGGAQDRVPCSPTPCSPCPGPRHRFHQFCSPFMTDSEFDAKPQVLLIGQYSTGKTTFIRYLLGTDFPNQRIGPEPTTDRFVAVLYDHEEKVGRE